MLKSMRCYLDVGIQEDLMARIKVYKNQGQGFAWLAEGEIRDCAYYDGADTLEELKAQIAEFWADEDIDIEVVLVTDSETDQAQEEAPLLLADR